MFEIFCGVYKIVYILYGLYFFDNFFICHKKTIHKENPSKDR